MQAADEGTVTEAPDTVATPATEPLPGFMDAMDALDPTATTPGNPEKATAVDTDTKETAPEAKPDDQPEKVEPEAKADDKPDPVATVNFDGFSDKQKATYERLLKAGHVTAEEVDEARKASLRQDLFSKKTAALAREREALEKSNKENEEDLKLLQKIRNDDRLHANWLKMSKGETAGDPAGEFDEDTNQKLNRLMEQRERENADRTAKEQKVYASRKEGLEAAVTEAMELHSITQEQLNSYLPILKAKVPQGADPVLHFTPSALQDQIVLLHEAATAKAEAAKLREQLAQRTSKAVQASKQSLPPTRRASEPSLTGMAKVLADLGVAKLSDVEGLGFEGPS